MGYRFCFGASGSGKSTLLHKYVLKNAADSLKKLGSDRTTYVVMVPDQYSLQTQKDLVTESDCMGILNVDVLSFSRLGYRIFEEIGASEQAVLNEIGKTLLIRREADKCEKELTVLGKGIHRAGMIGEVKSILSEFMQYGIDNEKIMEMEAYAKERGQGALSARLGDLRILYDAFKRGQKDRFITGEEAMDLLAEAIPKSQFIRDSIFVLDGFTGFTPVQYKVLMELIRYAKEVIISLTISEDGGIDTSDVMSGLSAGKEEALFYLTRKTVRDIAARAMDEGLVHSADPDITVREAHRFETNPMMAHLERSLFRHPFRAYGGSDSGAVSIFETNTPEEEVRHIFAKIQKLVLEKGYQYRDIAVVTGDLDVYGDLFERYAQKYHVPIYVDRTSKISLTPLTEAIMGALGIVTAGFSYEAVFAYLRSGMSDLTADEIDLLENYCLAHGIRGRRKWELPFDADTEPLRLRFLEELRPLIGEITADSTSPRKRLSAAQRTESLHNFMVSGKMESKMQLITERLEAEGDQVRSVAYAQLYESIVRLLEQIHDLVGDEQISAKDYAELLEAGIAEIRLGTLPQQVDRVLVGDIERTRIHHISTLFLTGANDGAIPKGASGGGLLSDLDRGFLSDCGVELAPTPRQQMYIQRFYLYVNMTKPSDQLIVSYSRVSGEGKSQRPSYLVQMIQRMYPAVSVEYPQSLVPTERLVGEDDSITYLAEKLRRFAEGIQGEDSQEERETLTLFGYLRQNADRTGNGKWEEIGTIGKLDGLREAAFKRYEPEKISPEAAARLYGDELVCGISRMETGANCYLRQFLQYGLQLQKRLQYEVEAKDTGIVMHDSLDKFAQSIHRKGLSWRNFTKEQGAVIIDEVLRDVSSQYNNLIMYSTERNRYQVGQMRRALERTVDTLQYQLRQGEFEPAAFELNFGGRGADDAMTYEIGDKKLLKLIGRIDRLDICEDDGRIYVKILDYKSGNRDLKEDEIRLGLQLQLILYMNSVLKLMDAENPRKEIVPSAMLYYRMRDPVLQGKDGSISVSDALQADQDRQSVLQEKMENSIRQQLRTTGLVNGDGDSLAKLDHITSGRSSVVPVTLTKDGKPTRSSRVYQAEDFRHLSEAAISRICQIAAEILGGNVTANPIILDSNRDSCQYCPYKESCGFDPRIPGYEYRRLENEIRKLERNTPEEGKTGADTVDKFVVKYREKEN